MKSYGQFCPIAVTAEIFAARWTPLILRELFAGSHHFNEIERGLPRISKSVLAQCLRALTVAGVIERRELGARSVDPEFLLWNIHRRIHLERLLRASRWHVRAACGRCVIPISSLLTI